MLIGNDMKCLLGSENYAELGYFVSTYEKTPQDYMERMPEYFSHLDRKVVVSLKFDEHNENKVTVGSVYMQKQFQKAVLEYHQDIAFIKVHYRNNLNQIIYKEGKCYPQSIAEWFSEPLNKRLMKKDFKKQDLVELIQTYVRGVTQNMNFILRAENLIILQSI